MVKEDRKRRSVSQLDSPGGDRSKRFSDKDLRARRTAKSCRKRNCRAKSRRRKPKTLTAEKGLKQAIETLCDSSANQIFKFTLIFLVTRLTQELSLIHI